MEEEENILSMQEEAQQNINHTFASSKKIRSFLLKTIADVKIKNSKFEEICGGVQSLVDENNRLRNMKEELCKRIESIHQHMAYFQQELSISLEYTRENNKVFEEVEKEINSKEQIIESYSSEIATEK